VSTQHERPEGRQRGSRLALAWRVASWAAVIVLLVIVVRRVYPAIDLREALATAPDFELLDLDGETFRLADHRGQVVVLNFWATWCPPCRAEIPGFIRLQNEFREDGVVFVGVALDEEGAEVVEPYSRQRGINYPVLLDRGAVARQFDGGRVVPTTLLIDRSGRIRFRHEGLLLAGALRPALAELAAEGR
jgi:thiol-disulfide isomerase/thioredoxin